MAITTTSNLTKPIRALYNAAALQAFTEEGTFWRSASIQEIPLGADGNRGKSVVFDLWSTVTTSTSALSETGDGTPATQAMTQVEVSLAEYGNHEQTTAKLRLTDYGSPEERAAWAMGENAQDTLDKLARDAYDSQTGATWVGYGGTATSVATLVRTDELTADDVREAFARLRANKVRSLDGGYYVCYIHPHVMKDLKDETGNGSWTVVGQYAQTLQEPIMFGEVGVFEGFRVVMTTNAKLQTKAGDGTTTSAASADVYSTYFAGAEAIGFGHAGDPIQVKVSGAPVPIAGDAYGRFQTIGWYSLSGFKALKADSLFKFYTSSSMAANGA